MWLKVNDEKRFTAFLVVQSMCGTSLSKQPERIGSNLKCEEVFKSRKRPTMTDPQTQNTKYFRRCHVCGSTSFSESHHMERCTHCHKPFAKFHYFDDRFTPIQSDLNLRSQSLPGEYLPLQGLTVYWDHYESDSRRY